MSKWIKSVGTSLFLTVPLVMAGGVQAAEKLNVVSWSGYFSPEILAKFQKQTGIEVTVVNGKGVLARIAGAMAAAEADIVHVDMGQETAQDAAELRFVLSVRDLHHLDGVMRQLKRTPSVIKVERLLPRG